MIVKINRKLRGWLEVVLVGNYVYYENFFFVEVNEFLGEFFFNVRC